MTDSNELRRVLEEHSTTEIVEELIWKQMRTFRQPRGKASAALRRLIIAVAKRL